MASGIIFEEIECKSLINKTVMPGGRQGYTVNPYRGCQHACIYCFARGTHEYLGYDNGRDFESRIIVKLNAAPVLKEELRRPSWRRQSILLGTACDPYQQAEIKYGITHKILRVMLEHAQPVHMLTKSPSVVRDIELWARLAEATDAQVAFSVPTLDEDVWKKTEPGTGHPLKRLKAMRDLTQAGVPCGIMLAPVIPGVTDDEAHLTEVVMAAKDHGATFIAPNVLHLKPGTKEWFMPALREAYPHLAGKYERYYRGSYAPKDYTREVLATIDRIRDKVGFPRERMPRRRAPNSQISLAI